jgi:hypothetical protein
MYSKINESEWEKLSNGSGYSKWLVKTIYDTLHKRVEHDTQKRKEAKRKREELVLKIREE